MKMLSKTFDRLTNVQCHADVKRFQNKFGMTAFTLAEVLITLGIIGIVAAMTLPSLIAKNQEKVLLSQFNAAYSMLENAYRMTMIDGTTYEDWGVTFDREDNKSNIIYEKFKPYLKIIEVCDHKVGCFPNVKYTDLIGNEQRLLKFYGDIDSVKLKLANGMLMYIADNTVDLGPVLIDTNGNKGPNKLGYDLFNFSFNKNYVTGANVGKHDIHGWQLFYCNVNGENSGWMQGLACTSWIIKKKNMDYLHRDIINEW